jgi:hypothetical protein
MIGIIGGSGLDDPKMYTLLKFDNEKVKGN